jgi:hypothetical protein
MPKRVFYQIPVSSETLASLQNPRFLPKSPQMSVFATVSNSARSRQYLHTCCSNFLSKSLSLPPAAGLTTLFSSLGQVDLTQSGRGPVPALHSSLRLLCDLCVKSQNHLREPVPRRREKSGGKPAFLTVLGLHGLRHCFMEHSTGKPTNINVFNNLAGTRSVRCKKAAHLMPTVMFSTVYLRHSRVAQCGAVRRTLVSHEHRSYPSFSFTSANMAVAMLTTMKVAMARQTASDSVNFQMASMQRTVQATS